MKLYEPSVEADLLVLNLWATLAATGDLDKTFTATLDSPSKFLHAINTMTLVYDDDERGIWIAAWYEPMMAGSFYGIWVREDKRGKTSVEPVRETVRLALDHVPILVAAVRDPEVLSSALWLGFEELGMLPHMFDGAPATIIYFTKERFDALEQERKHGNG